MTTTINPNAQIPAAKNGSKRKRALMILALVVVVAGIAWALWYLLVARWHEDTDDAYVQGNIVSITPQIADEQKLPVDSGALVGGFDQNGDPVSGIEAGKPADQGGVKDGDIITSINGKAIDEEHPLDATLSQFKPGDTITVDVLRDGQHVTLQVTLGTRPAGL